jgi:hypothetical protein
MIAANDTAAFPLGTTVESATWRAHRYSDSIRVTSLRGAGKVAKRLPEFTVCGDVESIAPAVLWAVEEGASVETMRAMLTDVTLAGLTFHETEKRGVDVPAKPAITVRGELMEGTFTETEARLCFTAIHVAADFETRFARGLQMFEGGTAPAIAAEHVKASTFRQDTLTSTSKRADAARAYAWAQQNEARLPMMTLGQFRAEMSAIGARFS